jgi:hypothetical protein
MIKLVRTVGLLGALLVAACAGIPSVSPSVAPTTAPTAEPSGGSSDGLLLRATQTQAVPPLSRFDWLPVLAVTDDLVVVVPGPQLDMYPGPLVPSLTGRSLAPGGWTQIVDSAETLGLLGDREDFTPADVMPGQALGRIELVVDGRRHDLVGDPTRLVRCGGTRCIPDPGTPEAFAAFWQQLSDLISWIPAELGAEQAYVAPAYAVLVDGPLAEPSPVEPVVLEWPLEPPLGGFGSSVGAAQLPRCGTVRGADADAVRPALVVANALTMWVDSPTTSAAFGLRVRPLLPGEDVCAELFGISG